MEKNCFSAEDASHECLVRRIELLKCPSNVLRIRLRISKRLVIAEIPPTEQQSVHQNERWNPL
jgi:hypothetical protein